MTPSKRLAELGYASANPNQLRLPECPIPRPGDSVGWYADSRFVTGTLIGHTIEGKPVIQTEFGSATIKESYSAIRLLDPFSRLGPNWNQLPGTGAIFHPPTRIRAIFEQLMSRRIPPGPTYLDLAQEIWARGFEVFIVGGTVRDVLGGLPPKDVDLVTTMPISFCRHFLRAMFRYEPSSRNETGYVRIGGTPRSGDPYLDLRVFSDSLVGTAEATFGVSFAKDVLHRDFACNAVYYDPVNEVLIDPTGKGILDGIDKTLSLVCGTGDPHQHAQITIRFAKFVQRGFTPTTNTIDTIRNEYANCISCMKQDTRKWYLTAQVLNKGSTPETVRQVLIGLESVMTSFGMANVWNEHLAPHVEELCRG